MTQRIVLPFDLCVISGATQTMRMLGSAAVGALMGAVLNAIGTGPDHLRMSITAIFTLTGLIALFPATLGRPKVSARLPSEYAGED